MKSPLVSVLIPVHNGERYLKECLDSVISQDYLTFEVVVINDGSTDGTKNILNGYEDIKVVDIDKQTALSDVLNTGLKHCEGEYVARMDADDVMLPGRLSKQVAYLEENPGVGVVGAAIELIDKESKVVSKRRYSGHDKRLKDSLWVMSPFAHPAVMYRKNLVLGVGGYPMNTPKVEDITLWFKLSQVTKFSNLQDTVIRYRKTDSSESLGNLKDTFKNTVGVRNWAKDELGISPSPLFYFLWKVEELLVKVLPIKFLYSISELFRKVV